MPRPRRPTMSIPFAAASTGQKAREEISRILRGFGCESVGFMDDFDDHSVLLPSPIAVARFNYAPRHAAGPSCT
jgi:hypothetical protein